MPLPEQLERLKDISIDTLGLSESTLAVLKWYGITHVLDCIAFFCLMAQQREAGDPWPRLFRLMFGDVRAALIAAGNWDLMLDEDVWRFFHEQYYPLGDRRVVRWQGRDVDLGEIPLEELGITDMPAETHHHFSDLGECLTYFLYMLNSDPEYWFALDKGDGQESDTSLSQFEVFLFAVVQPRLVELGLWAFVEAHLDDFDGEDSEVDWDEIEWEEREAWENGFLDDDYDWED